MEEYITYWKNLELTDLLNIILILCMVLVTIASNMVFRKFSESKPSGRKTVLGNKKPCNILKLSAT
jgi:hypothetical protein